MAWHYARVFNTDQKEIHKFFDYVIFIKRKKKMFLKTLIS